MAFWKQKPKIHLSPRLARTIGKSGRSGWYYIGQMTLAIAFAFGIFSIFSGDRNGESLQSQGRAFENRENGEILGAQTSNVLNYQVQPGDSLISISQRFNVYWLTIVEENELKPPYKLTPGQILTIPLPREQ